MYKYIAVDFDGTILNSKHKLDLKLIKLFKELQKKGIIIIPASGRNISQMMDYIKKFNDFEYPTYIISDNGGTIHHMSDKLELVNEIVFDDEVINYIYENFKHYTKDFLVFKNGKCYCEKMSLMQRFVSYKFKRKVIFEKPNGGSKVIMVDKVDNISKCYDEVKTKLESKFSDINVFRSVRTLIEITPNGATKGSALSLIFEKNKYERQSLICFGDGENDIDMLKFAGHSVAMSNAFDNVKNISDEVCLSNDENGVYEYLVSLNQ